MPTKKCQSLECHIGKQISFCGDMRLIKINCRGTIPVCSTWSRCWLADHTWSRMEGAVKNRKRKKKAAISFWEKDSANNIKNGLNFPKIDSIKYSFETIRKMINIWYKKRRKRYGKALKTSKNLHWEYQWARIPQLLYIPQASCGCGWLGKASVPIVPFSPYHRHRDLGKYLYTQREWKTEKKR